MDKSIFTIEGERAAARIASLRRPDSLVFPFFTDPHAHTLSEDGMTSLFAALSSIADAVPCDGVLALGDNLAMLGRERHASDAEIAGLLAKILERASACFSCPLYPVNGNHDGIGTDFFKPDLWYKVSRGYDRGTAVREGESAYYYVDFPGVRMICLSLPSNSDLTAAHPTPAWEYGDAQLRWLAHTALACDCPVLLVMHVPFYYEYRGERTAMLGTWNGTRATESTIAVLCGWIADRDTAAEIFAAFQNHTDYDNTALGIHMAPSGEHACLIAALSGHMHNDSFWRPGEEKITGDADSGGKNTLPCAQFVTASANPAINPDLRDHETVPATLDIAVVTPSERTITLVRYGDGEDRAWRW